MKKKKNSSGKFYVRLGKKGKSCTQKPHGMKLCHKTEPDHTFGILLSHVLWFPVVDLNESPSFFWPVQIHSSTTSKFSQLSNQQFTRVFISTPVARRSFFLLFFQISKGKEGREKNIYCYIATWKVCTFFFCIFFSSLLSAFTLR